MPNGSCSEKGTPRFCTVLGGGLQIFLEFSPRKLLGDMESNLTSAYFWKTELKPPTNVKISPSFELMAFVGDNDFGELDDSWWKHSRNGELGDELGWELLDDFFSSIRMISEAKNREKPTSNAHRMAGQRTRCLAVLLLAALRLGGWWNLLMLKMLLVIDGSYVI